MSEFLTYKIRDGVLLHHIKTDKFKTVSMSLNFHRPLRREEASLNALLTDVIRRGNQTYRDTAAVSRYLQSLYGGCFEADVRRKGEDQILSFVVNTVSDAYLPHGETCVQQGAALLYDMVFSPQVKNDAFREDYVAQEKVNLINDIEAQMNDKRSYAVWRLVEEMCQGEAYGIHELGTVEDVERITPESLYAQYLTVIRESPVDIYVTGHVDLEPILALSKERFESLKTERGSYPKAEPYRPKAELVRLTEAYDVSQAKLSIGFYTGILPTDSRYYTLMVYNSIFGGGAHSKLFNNVREKLSLAYYASSKLERYKGFMVVSSGIEYKNHALAETEIFAQAKAMAEGDITDYEFEVSIKSIVNSLRSLSDSGGYLMDYYLGQAVSGTCVSLEEQCQAILAVKKEDVISLAKEIKPEMVYVMKGLDGEGMQE